MCIESHAFCTCLSAICECNLRMQLEILAMVQEAEPLLASFLHTNILAHPSLGKALSHLLASKMQSRTLLGTQLMRLIFDAYQDDSVSPEIKCRALLQITLPQYQLPPTRHCWCRAYWKLVWQTWKQLRKGTLLVTSTHSASCISRASRPFSARG